MWAGLAFSAEKLFPAGKHPCEYNAMNLDCASSSSDASASLRSSAGFRPQGRLFHVFTLNANGNGFVGLPRLKSSPLILASGLRSQVHCHASSDRRNGCRNFCFPSTRQRVGIIIHDSFFQKESTCFHGSWVSRQCEST